jgi:tight adherence protein C
MTPLLAFDFVDVVPLIVFGAIVIGAWFLMAAFTRRASRAEERLTRIGRPTSSPDLDELDVRRQRFGGLKDVIAQLGGAMEGQSDLEKNKLKLQLANGGFRSDSAPMIYQGLRLLCIVLFLVPTTGIMLVVSGFTQKTSCCSWSRRPGSC